MKKLFLNIAIITLVILLFIGIHISYNPSNWINFFLWVLAYPILSIVFYYFVYSRKDSYLNIARLRNRLIKAHESKWMIRSIGWLFVLFAPAILIVSLKVDLGLIINAYATKKFSEEVTVNSILCLHYTRRSYNSSLQFTVVKGTHFPYEVDFPYSYCRKYPHIANLDNKNIWLYGRSSILGKVYDGFAYSSSININ